MPTKLDWFLTWQNIRFKEKKREIEKELCMRRKWLIFFSSPRSIEIFLQFSFACWLSCKDRYRSLHPSSDTFNSNEWSIWIHKDMFTYGQLYLTNCKVIQPTDFFFVSPICIKNYLLVFRFEAKLKWLNAVHYQR